jgi:hypothetical protein
MTSKQPAEGMTPHLVVHRVVATALILLLSCGGSELRGTATFDPAPIDLGASPCNAVGTPVQWRIRNDASDGGRLHYSARTEGAFALASPTEVTLEAGEPGTIIVEPRVPRTAARLSTVTGTLVVTTSDPAHPEIRVPLSAVATGAELHFGDPVDLGEVPVAGQSDLPLRIENKGDDAVSVDFGAPDVPTFQTKVASVQVGAHSSNVDAVFHFQAISVGTVTTRVPVSYRGAICGDPPTSIELRAKGVTGVAVSPGKVDFGMTDCGTSATSQAVTLTNTTKASVNYTVTQQHPERFKLFGTSGSIPPGFSDQIAISPSVLALGTSTAPNGVGDVLTITTDLAGDAPHTVVLAQTAYGAVLSLPAKTNVGRKLVDANPASTVTLPLTNSGNAPAQVSGATSGITASFPSTAVAAGATVNVTATLTPDPAHLGFADARTLAYAADAPLCGADPPEIEMTPFDLAVDLDYPDNRGGCIAGRTGRIYCFGPYNSITLPAPSEGVTYFPDLVGTRVFIEGPSSLWVQNGATLTSNQPLVLKTFSLPNGTGKLQHPTGGGNPRFCANDAGGQFRCIGSNENYEFGNGVATAMQWTQWHPAMSGLATITDYAAINLASLVVSGGSVYGAGQNVGDLFRTGVSFGYYPTPVPIAGLSNVARIAISYFGACALHVGGTVSCWNTNDPNTPIQPVAGIVDAVDLATFGGVCVIRQNGSVRCSDRAPLPNLWDPPGLALPVQKVTPYAALEANGAVTSWYGTYPQTFRFKGFEGP